MTTDRSARARQGARREALREAKREGTRLRGGASIEAQAPWRLHRLCRRGGAARPVVITAQKLLGMSLEGAVG